MSGQDFSALHRYAKSAYTIPTAGGFGNGTGITLEDNDTCVGNNRGCELFGDSYRDTGLVTFACIFGMLAVLSGYYVYRRRAKLEHGLLLLFLLCASQD